MTRSLGFVLLGAVAGCAPAPAKGGNKAPPALVTAAQPESALATIALTTQAEARLGIEVARVERKPVERVRILGGEIVAPPGAALTIRAPLSGELVASGALPGPNAAVKRGQPLFVLTPLPGIESAVTWASLASDAEGAAKRAVVEVEAARIALDRAVGLVESGAGSARARDEAHARFAAAEAAQEAARARRAAVETAIGRVKRGQAAALPIESPLDGRVSALHVGARQFVASGAPLFDVLASTRLWVRLPVYVGDLDALVEGRDVEVGNLAARPGAETRTARPVAAPPSADPTAATVDFYYEVDNADGALRPGQRVAVTVRLADPAESLVAPWAAVVHDIHGGAWVYERAAPHAFRRRRVRVRYVHAGTAVLSSGPAPGTEVVTAGVAELFGEEFGAGK